MSGFKSFSQKTTTNQNVLLSAANEHSEVKVPTESQPVETLETEISDQPDPNNK